jgi:phenylalanyl-tRNA synthetase beta chain
LHPGKQAAIVIAGNRQGVVGELHPKVLEAFEIPGTACLFEIDLTALLSFTIGYRMFQPVPRFPSIDRDIALVVDAKVSNQEVQDIIKGFSLVNRITIFDVYTGGQLPPSKKSLAYRITFQSPTHTLTDKEVNKVQRQILDKLSSKLGATLRS